MKLHVLGVVVMGVLLASPARAQNNSLVGVWERVSATNDKGEANPNPGLIVAMTADGQFVQAGIPKGRPKVDKPAAQLTDAEFRARFTGVGAQYGTYTVSGNHLTRHTIGAINPNVEGTDEVTVFRIEGDTLIATSTTPNSKAEARFRRVHANAH